MAEQSTEQAVAEIWELFRATDAKFKETDAKFKETDARLDKRFQETDEKLRRLEGLFGSQWGKFIEALVQPNALRLFQEKGIQVHYVNQCVLSQLNGRHMEIDLILENDQDVIAIEVKSILKVQSVNDFLADLDEFLYFFPKYKGRRILGGIAGLTIEEDADRYAYRAGLFVLSMSGDGIVQIRNDEKFIPKDFAK
ncbi:DUF3782 domain-containing protein [Chloroflexi bacterium TSY]|nr:DUF3782 domain-containing protein [Chloroflexi bacterium TSY]